MVYYHLFLKVLYSLFGSIGVDIKATARNLSPGYCQLKYMPMNN
jgi:hypothetical protein